MGLFTLAVPIPQGKLPAYRRFLSELTGPRRAEFEASRRREGVRERTWLQPTPVGDLVVLTIEGEDPAGAFARMNQQGDEFTGWLHRQISEIFGIDLSKPPSGPPPELVIDSGA